MESQKDEPCLVLSDRSTTRKLIELLASNNMEEVALNGAQPIEMLTSSEYSINYLIINIDFADFDNIIQASNNHSPDMPIIVIFDKSKMEREQADKILDKFSLKYSIEKSTLKMNEFTKLIDQVKAERPVPASSDSKPKERYTFIKKIGTGANAEVDLVKDNELDIFLAAKKISLEGMNEQNKIASKKEVENMKNVVSPTIIRLYDSSVHNNVRYIYLEFAKEGTLEDKIYTTFEKEKKKFTETEILEWTIEILLSLWVLKNEKMIHRDIKSENILLTENNIAKLADLGITKVVDGEGNHTSCGTPYYISPEIACGGKYDFNTDIWSLGIILYEMIMGKKPFEQVDALDLYESIKLENYEPLTPNTHPALVYLVELMLRKNPKRRYNVDELLSLDIIYDGLMTLIEAHNWKHEIPKYEELIKIKRKAFFPTLPIITDEEFKIMQDLLKVADVCPYKSYKASMFGGQLNFTRIGSDLYESIEEIFKNLKSEGEREEFLNKLIEDQILVSVNSKQDFDENEYYYFNFESSEKQKIDNVYVKPFTQLNDYVDLEAISQSVLYEAMLLMERINAEQSKIDITTSTPYIKFITGISYFQNYKLNDLQLNARTATILNIYQIMLVHYILKLFILSENGDAGANKGGFLNYFKNNSATITYKFADMSLTNQEILHVIFRNNKKPPGSYMRLVYDNSEKTKIIPYKSDFRPLFILYDFNDEYLKDLNNQSSLESYFRLQIFENKELDDQLDELVLAFMTNYVTQPEEGGDIISLPSFVKLYVQEDFTTEIAMFKMFQQKYLDNLIERGKSVESLLEETKIDETEKKGEKKLPKSNKPLSLRIRFDASKIPLFNNSKLISSINKGKIKFVYDALK